jgi:serine/threonine protein phosphatase PrpC
MYTCCSAVLRLSTCMLAGRSLGDLTAATVGCTSDPEVSFTTLRPGVDHVLVMASDGVWDVLTNEQVCDIVVESPDPHIACR